MNTTNTEKYTWSETDYEYMTLDYTDESFLTVSNNAYKNPMDGGERIRLHIYTMDGSLTDFAEEVINNATGVCS